MWIRKVRQALPSHFMSHLLCLNNQYNLVPKKTCRKLPFSNTSRSQVRCTVALWTMPSGFLRVVQHSAFFFEEHSCQCTFYCSSAPLKWMLDMSSVVEKYMRPFFLLQPLWPSLMFTHDPKRKDNLWKCKLSLLVIDCSLLFLYHWLW